MNYSKYKRPTHHENIYVNCKNCGRPYKKGENYPNEVCPICEQEA